MRAWGPRQLLDEIVATWYSISAYTFCQFIRLSHQYLVMQPQQNFGSPGAGEQFCAQCGSPMPKEMRFCRSCGNRLGEGPAEYTETVRLPNSANARSGDPFRPGFTPPMMRPGTSSMSGKRKRRLGGMTWVFIAIAVFF